MNAHEEIKETGINPGGQDAPESRRNKPAWKRVLTWTAGIVGGAIALVIILLCVATWWLTPARLSEIVGREASRALDADVKVADIEYTLWSTFPRLDINIDSISVRSRNFDHIPDSLRAKLPAGADFLLSARSIKGGVNLVRLFSGRVWLKDIEADRLKVNLVAATDSLNNFDIVPGGGQSKVPRFRIDGLRINGSGYIAYTSLPSATKAEVRLRDAALTPVRFSGRHDDYDLTIKGLVDVTSGTLDVLRDFPFELGGTVGVRFSPFGISTSDYRVALGGIRGAITMNMDIGDNPRVNDFAYDMKGFRLQDLLQLLPGINSPVLEGLNADLQLDATARLTDPYEFSSAWLPSIEVDFRIPDGKVSYTFSDRAAYTLRHVGLSGRFVFDGREPSESYIDVPDLYMSGEGVEVNLAGKVTSLTAVPQISASLSARGDLTRIGQEIAMLRPYGLGGDMEVEADVSFSLDGTTLSGSVAGLKISSGRLDMACGPTRLSVRDFSASTRESYPAALTRGAVLSDIPLRLRVSAGEVDVKSGAGAPRVRISGLKADGELGKETEGDVTRTLRLAVDARRASLGIGGKTLALRNAGVRFDASRLRTPVKAPAFRKPAKWDADARTRGFAAHTPEYLQVSLPPQVRDLMAQWRACLDLSVASGTLATPRDPQATVFSGLGLTASADSLRLRRVTLGSGQTRGTISASVRNLRQFLTSPVPAPLYVTLDADIDTIQINQLARAYATRNPDSAIARGDSEAMAEGVDSVALLIPRNLYADIQARALQTRYINLHLYDLLARVRLADGRADIDTVRIGSDFGQAAMNMTFDTSDMQDINMAARLNITDINIVNFFKNFHKLLLMMPEMSNVSGVISADVGARLRIFPSMFLNSPSVTASATIGVNDLFVRQSPFISRVTRMLQLPDNETLHIRDIAVHAGVRDNLLEIYPFEFEMMKYRLVLGGVNNFNGGLYYHVGVIDWPLKIPFGVNIKGEFHHPQLRFGGKSWHDDNGARITEGIDDNVRINILRMGRRYMGEFVHTAATYTGQ